MELRSSRSRSKTPFKTIITQEIFNKEVIKEGDNTNTRTTRSSTIKLNEMNTTESKFVKLKNDRKKLAMGYVSRKINKTSDYSSEEGENEVSSTKTISQNEKNQLIEDARAAANGSAQVSALDLYIKSGRYWDVYPKTDWTYSPHSKDRVEIAPGVIAMPNMSRRAIHSLDAVSSSYTTNVLHKTTNTESAVSSDVTSIRNSGYIYDALNTNIRPRKLFNNDGQQETIDTKSKHTMVRWRRTVANIFIMVTYLFYYLNNVQTYFFSKLHHLSSRLMLLDTWLMMKRTTRTNKVALVLFLCLLPLLFFWGWWLLSSLGNFMYLYLNSTATGNFPVVKNNIEEQTVKIDEKNINVSPSASEIAAKLSKEQLEAIAVNVLLNNRNQENNFKDELNTIRDDLYKFQAYNAYNVAKLKHQIGRCCEKPIINVEKQILNALNDANFLGKQNGFNNYLRSLFTAKTELEIILRNLTQNLHDSFNNLVKDNSKILMSEVADKVKQQSLIGNYELPSDKHIHKIVKNVLKIYDADRTGLVDYALESMGGQVLTTRCTENYQSGKAVVSVLGIPLWYPVNSPRTVITPELNPGQCWAFQNFPGFLVIKLSHFVKIDAFSMEHVSKLLVPNENIDSAPKEFEVYGLLDEDDKSPVLLGRYIYDYDGESLQYFSVENVERVYNIIELRILSNHGHPNYTCLYRFRVHGQTV